MKTNALLAFFFFFVTALFAFTSAEVVHDADGDILHNGRNYYFVSPGLGGKAITVADVGNSDDSCSIAIVHKLLLNKGMLTRIASRYVTSFIATTFPLWLSFPGWLGSCTLSREWIVTRDSDGLGDVVMMGDDNLYPNHLSGVFCIKTYDSAKFHYKLVFCSEHVECRHVGSKTDSHGNHRLVVTEDKNVKPLVFKFVKETSDISMVV